MIVVLDSNEYIIFLRENSGFLNKIIEIDIITIHINELILKEVLRNIDENAKKSFYTSLLQNNITLHNDKLPYYLFEKYKQLNLKKGDIAIAAFCESIGAAYLISENRHFLREVKFDKFKVLTMKDFMGMLGK